MRKILFLALTLFAVVSASLTLPKAEAQTASCEWRCEDCMVYCTCNYCKDPLPVCPCR